ncbi:hypothetical protein LTR95_006037 [Oleoguttula sp. CCFEE 5521]
MHNPDLEPSGLPDPSATEKANGVVDIASQPFRFCHYSTSDRDQEVEKTEPSDSTYLDTVKSVRRAVKLYFAFFDAQKAQTAILSQASHFDTAFGHIYSATPCPLTRLSPHQRGQQQSHQRKLQKNLPQAQSQRSSARDPNSDQPLVSYADWRQENKTRQTRLARAKADLETPRISRKKKSPEELRAVVQQAEDEYNAWKHVRWSYTEHELVEKRAKDHRKSKAIAEMSSHDTWLLERGRLAAILRRAERRANAATRLSDVALTQRHMAAVMRAREKLEQWVAVPHGSK